MNEERDEIENEDEVFDNSESFENDSSNFEETLSSESTPDSGGSKSAVDRVSDTAKSVKDKGVKGAAIDAAKDKAKDIVPGAEGAVEVSGKAASAVSAVGSAAAAVKSSIVSLGAIFSSPVTWVILIIVAIVLQLSIIGFYLFAGYQAFGSNESACVPGGSASNITVDMSGDWVQNGNQIANYLTTTPFEFTGGKPMTPKQAAAVIGNMKSESQVDPKLAQANSKGPWTSSDTPNSTIIATSGGGKALGLIQWDGVRRTDLASFAESSGRHWSDPTVQLEFLKNELDGAEGSNLASAGFNDPSKTVEELAYIFTDKFERPGKDPKTGDYYHAAARKADAAAFLQQYGGGGSYDASVFGGVGGNCVNDGGGAAAVATGQFAHPNPGATVTSPFGMRVHPISGKKKMHKGIDYAKSCGSEIKAADAGTIVHAGWANGAAGNRVEIDHGNGFTTKYAHVNSKIPVKVGQSVNQGDVIAYEDTTGGSTGCHLHFEIIKDGQYMNPADYVAG